jgi:hypothetical protein
MTYMNVKIQAHNSEHDLVKLYVENTQKKSLTSKHTHLMRINYALYLLLIMWMKIHCVLLTRMSGQQIQCGQHLRSYIHLEKTPCGLHPGTEHPLETNQTLRKWNAELKKG